MGNSRYARMTELNSGPHALVLSGGGAYAAYEIGVMRALCSGASPASGFIPVQPKILTGTSAGAYNATFLVSQGQTDSLQAVENLESVWLRQLANHPDGCSNGLTRYRLDPFRILNPVCFMADPAGSVTRFADDISFLSKELTERALWFAQAGGPIEERFAKLVDLSLAFAERIGVLIPETIAFEDIAASPLLLRIAATNWSKGELQIYANEDMADPQAPLYVQASTATPGIFPPVHIGSQVYVDGGVLMNTPLQPAIDAGAGTLHVIYLDPDISKIPITRLRSTLDTMERIWAIQNAQSLNVDIDTASRVNRGLEALRNPAGPLARAQVGLKDVVRLLGRLVGRDDGASAVDALSQYRQVTIHRYHPDDDLGGFSGFLNFDRSAIEGLVRRGYEDAAHHDCTEEGCIGPSGALVQPPADKSVEAPSSIRIS